MITTVRDGSKAIIQYVLNEAVNHGKLKHSVTIEDAELSNALKFPDENHFLVCLQYLSEKGLISAPRDNSGRHIAITAEAIDFLESN